MRGRRGSIECVPVTNKNAPISYQEELIVIGKAFYERKWITNAAGNFSAVICRQPLELAFTKSGVPRGSLTRSDFIYLDNPKLFLEAGQPLSAEMHIHWAITSNTSAGAVLQTHSVWSTVLANVYAEWLELEGFEVLKSLSPVTTGRDLEWVPILENFSDSRTMAEAIGGLLKVRPELHTILLRKHGLYTWGATVQEAAHHVEIFELLFEVLVRQLHIFSQADRNNVHGPYS